MKKILFILFVVCFNNQVIGQQQNISLSLKPLGDGNTSINWTNPIKNAIQISLQRSLDSTNYFKTVYSPANTNLKNYSFIDFYPVSTKEVFYRILVVDKNTNLLFSNSFARSSTFNGVIGFKSNSNTSSNLKTIEVAKATKIIDSSKNINQNTETQNEKIISTKDVGIVFRGEKSNLPDTYQVKEDKNKKKKNKNEDEDGVAKELNSKSKKERKEIIDKVIAEKQNTNNTKREEIRKAKSSIDTLNKVPKKVEKKVEDDFIITSSKKKKSSVQDSIKKIVNTQSNESEGQTALSAKKVKTIPDTAKQLSANVLQTKQSLQNDTKVNAGVYGPPGKLVGKVINAKTGEGINSATVTVEGGQIKKSQKADYNGSFSFSNLPSGVYTISVTNIGFAKKTIEVTIVKDEVTNQDIVLNDSKDSKLDDVEIKSSGSSKRNVESVNSLLIQQKNAASVSDGISAETIKRTPDKNTSDILKRVSGASIQDDKFVIVRGLNDRYNTPLLNSSVLPSTESNRKAFAFDIFPASMLDNLTITKTATPDMHSEFVGGIINIVTKDIPTKDFQSFTFSLGYNTQATFKDRKYYKGGRWDWLGLDDGTRAIPSNIPTKDLSSLSNTEKAQYGKSFANNWKILNSNNTPNISFQYSRGFNFQKNEKDFAGLLIGLTYSKSNTISLGERSSVEYARGDTSANPVYTYFINENIYSTQYLSGLIVNGSLKFNNNNKLSLKNSISINSDDKVVNWNGFLNYPDSTFRTNTNLRWFTSNVLATSQLIGEHFVPKAKLKINWLAAYNSINRNLPNQRRSGQNIFTAGNIVEQAVTNVAINQESNGSMIFSKTKENSNSIQLDLSRTFTFNNKFNILVKAGAYLSSRHRDFSTRVLGVQASTQNFDQSLIKLDEGDIWNSKNFGTLKNGKNGFYLTEKYERSNTYDASSSVFSRYAMIDTRLFKFMRLIGGVRIETFNQKLNTFDDALNKEVRTDNTYTDINPSVNYIISLNSKQNLRFCYSQTLNRPEYRELATVLFYDNDTRLNVYGNYNLSRALAQNYDFRYEYYPSAGQIISVSAFHKKIQNPIELVFDQSQTSVAFYNNAVQSAISGLEFECRFSFAQLFKNSKNQFLKQLTFFGNMALMKSDVELGDISKFGKNRWLQGQSPYQYNGGFIYQNKSGLSATVQINEVGQRIFIAGNPESVNIMEKSRPVLDFQIAKVIEKDNIEVKLNVKDILALPQVFFYDINDNNKFDFQDKTNLNNPSKYADLPFRERRFGTVISASVTYKF